MATLKTRVWASDPASLEHPGYTMFDADMEKQGWVFVQNAEIEYTPLMRDELIAGGVLNLRKQREAMVEEQVRALRRLDEAIQNLLSLTYDQPTEVKATADDSDDDIPF